eukprot:CAMPEP_0202344986 /NCGR_PEP_ID=MMETSP1126-20121109/4421_1 /ASSEMBLY_ACC=CAM_ASM_000457 /TAXON_ID=3047 /ORGANISM="Dunaliella tertiolecta, Strain CCMP1320" /LENGTH=46 /DNA_ID= /DNA_START= /DNA_END= /DNA_ORIENTATION=
MAAMPTAATPTAINAPTAAIPTISMPEGKFSSPSSETAGSLTPPPV